MRLPIGRKKKLSPTTIFFLLISLRPGLTAPRSTIKKRGDYLAIGVNAIKITKKDKNKNKDLCHVKCYIYKQKGHYVNMYPKKPKNL